MRLHYRKNKFNESIELHRNIQDPDNHKYSPLIFSIGCSLPNRMLSDRRSRCTQCFIQHFTISLLAFFVANFIWPINSCDSICASICVVDDMIFECSGK